MCMACTECMTSCFEESAKLFGLEISLKKIEVLHQPAPQEEYHAPHISFGETDLKSVQQFIYLTYTISSNAKIWRLTTLAKAQYAFGKLYKHVWNNRHMRSNMKIRVYCAVILTTLLSESWITC